MINGGSVNSKGWEYSIKMDINMNSRPTPFRLLRPKGAKSIFLIKLVNN